jgi:hypothetical protein
MGEGWRDYLRFINSDCERGNSQGGWMYHQKRKMKGYRK